MKFKLKSGFSFVEVMVALVILSISLVILFESQTRSMDLVSRANSIDVAVALAGAKMTELSSLAEQKGASVLKSDESGDFDQEKYPGYHWKYTLSSIPAPDFMALLGHAQTTGGEENNAAESSASMIAGPLQQISKMWAEGVKELHLEVTWKDGAREKSYDLVTHLIASDAMNQIQGFVNSIGKGKGG
jgi:general secretion pathway protein I